MIIGVSSQCIYIPPDVFPSVPRYAITLGKDGRSIVDRVTLSNYFLRIGRSCVNINSTLRFLSYKQNSRDILFSQIRRSPRTLTTLGGLRYGCLLTQRLELYPHGSLRALKVFNDNHDIPVLRLISLTRRLCAFRMHGYMIYAWFCSLVFTQTSQYPRNFFPRRHGEDESKRKYTNRKLTQKGNNQKFSSEVTKNVHASQI